MIFFRKIDVFDFFFLKCFVRKIKEKSRYVYDKNIDVYEQKKSKKSQPHEKASIAAFRQRRQAPLPERCEGGRCRNDASWTVRTQASRWSDDAVCLNTRLRHLSQLLGNHHLNPPTAGIIVSLEIPGIVVSHEIPEFPHFFSVKKIRKIVKICFLDSWDQNQILKFVDFFNCFIYGQYFLYDPLSPSS